MTGFLGRTGLFEWLKITDEIREFVLRLSSKGEHRGSPLLNSGGKTMRRDGFAKVLKGMTTIDEVLKATHEG
jgi:general secretion pathway protein E